MKKICCILLAVNIENLKPQKYQISLETHWLFLLFAVYVAVKIKKDTQRRINWEILRLVNNIERYQKIWLKKTEVKNLD